MNFLPFENIQATSLLKKEEVLSTINRHLEETRQFGFGFQKHSLKKYEGYVDTNTFKFRRILKTGMNSFIPIIHGVVEDAEEGSIIKLKIRLPKMVYIFLIVVSIPFPFGGFMFSLTGLLFLIAPYLLATIVFMYESNVVKTDLNKMLEE